MNTTDIVLIGGPSLFDFLEKKNRHGKNVRIELIEYSQQSLNLTINLASDHCQVLGLPEKPWLCKY